MISVIIPLYNGAVYIGRSIRSALAQKYQDFELIVVDDGSIDRGADVVRDFSDSRIKIISQDNRGVSAARNRGIEEGRGDSIAFLDADDEWDPDFLGAVVALRTQFPEAGLVGTGYRMVYPSGPAVEITVPGNSEHASSILISDFFSRSTRGPLLHTSGIMIPRHVFDDLGGFLVGESRAEDIEMWARIALRYPIGYDTRILFSFHQTPKANKPRYREASEADPKVRMLTEYLSKRAGPDAIAADKLVLKHLKRYLWQMGFWHINYADLAAARRFLTRNEGSRFVPILSGLIGNCLTWPFMKVIAWLYRCYCSRLLMRFLGHERISAGVIRRLAREHL